MLLILMVILFSTSTLRLFILASTAHLSKMMNIVGLRINFRIKVRVRVRIRFRIKPGSHN